ncbi:MAG: SAP domain-containing protein [Burkholderiales bacterium]|nr:SAP domain-containing protein [Burkholderiales bacterium]MDE2455221.1 SAP domain-containing protein [Burkholderiales bacterium]
MFDFLFGRSKVEQNDQAGASMPATGAAIDWRSSPAHLNLLCHFLPPKARVKDLRQPWADALGEAPAVAIDRFVALGLLKPWSVETTLDRAKNVAQIKGMLKDRGLPVFGAKAALIARLVAADGPGVGAAVDGLGGYECTPAGEQIAQQRAAALAAQKDEAIRKSLAQIRAKRYAEAFEVARAFKAEAPPDRHAGLGAEFMLTDKDPVGSMIAFAAGRPKIFGSLPEATWEAVRIAAAMSRLWGGGLRPWMAEGVDSVGRFDLRVAYQLLVVSDADRRSRAMLSRLPHPRATVMCTRSDSCAACRALAGRVLPLEKIPELPNPGCENATEGCRCHLRPVLDFGSA